MYFKHFLVGRCVTLWLHYLIHPDYHSSVSLILLGFNGVNTILTPTVPKDSVGLERFQAQSRNPIESGEMLNSCK